MSHDEFERLADLAMDGRIGAAERERLEALAATDPGLRERWADLLAARAGLAGAELEPLPSGLHEALIGVARAGGRHRAERGSWLSFITAAIQVRPVFALGGAVAAGIAIGAVGLGLIAGVPGPGRDLAPATSASLPPAPAAPGSTSSLALDEGGAHVELSARREADGTVVRIDAGDATPGTLTLAWDPAAGRVVGLRWAGEGVPAFDPAPGRVTVAIPAAAGLELTFEELVNGGIPVRATLSVDGREAEATLRPPR